MFSRVSIWEIALAWRNCFRNPGFLLVAALTLGLGIGACVSTFALIDNFLLTPPPYSDPSRLAMLGPVASSPLTTMSPLQYQQLPGLADYSMLGSASVIRFWNVAGTGQPVLVPGRPVDRGFLAVLGIKMVQGRNFTEEEDRPGGPLVAILSYQLWLSHFAGSADVIGKVISLDGKPATIVGILPSNFQFVEPIHVLVPLALREHSRDRGNHLMVIAHLAAGIRLDRASADLNTLMHSRATEIGLKPSDHTIFSATSLWHDLSGSASSVVFMFFAFSLCLLGLVGANLSNLLLLRSVVKTHDTAVRTALGADMFRSGLSSFAEGLLVGLLGMICGLVLAILGLSWINGYIPLNWMNSMQGAHLGPLTYIFAVLLGAAVPFLSSVLAVKRSRLKNVSQELVVGSRAGWSPRLRRAGRILLIVQVCLASALLTLALTFARSLSHLAKVDLGLDPAPVLTFTVNPLPVQYPDAAAMQSFTRNLVERLRQLPAAEQVAASTNLPIGPPFSIPLKLSDGETRNLQYRPVTAGFFDVFGIPRLAGRDFSDQDTQGNEGVAIVNAAFAQRYFKGHALGESIQLGLKPNNILRVVGVMGDVHQSGPQFPVEPVVYVPLAQVSDSLLQDMRQFLATHFFLRVKGSPGLAGPSVSAAVQEIAPNQAITDLTPFGEIVGRLTASQRLDMKLVAILSLLALIVANVGLYSVASVSLASQKRDFGIQAALGAVPQTLVTRILTRVLQQILAGLVIGVFAGFLVSRYLRNMVTGLDLAGMSDVSITGFLFVLVGIAVCLGPAVRAARINPTIVLRDQ